MSEHETPPLLAELLEDYHRRRALGERPAPEEYREKAGTAYEELLQILAAEQAIDGAMGVAGEPAFPKPFGAYTLLRELGRGAMGVVYEAVHRDLGRTVALKILKTGVDTDRVALERFRREARACAQIRHDNIVAVYEAGEVEGKPFYAMALLKGKPLSDLAKEGGLPPPREFAAALAGVADALHRLHEAGIIHRDVKPSNIMREEGGRMVLADFGLARTIAAESLTQSGDSLGTPLYMSPEQLLGDLSAINGRSDVYGLGATTYEVLAGRPMFKAEDMRALMRMILAERPDPLHVAAPQIPRELSDIVMKAVEKNNGDRYESAAALRDDLLAFSRGEAVLGRPVPVAVHALRKARRYWIPLAAAAGILIAFTIWTARRPGTLEVRCYPAAEVLIDGAARGMTPQSLRLAPGVYELKLKTPGFEETAQRIEMGAGETKMLERALIASDPTDPEALNRLAQEFHLAMATLSEAPEERMRGGASGEIFALYPRGLVRQADLDVVGLYVGIEAATDGTLEFRAAGKTLFSAPLAPEDGNEWIVRPVPDAVRTSVKVGDKVTWGFFPAKGKPVTGEFTVARENTELREKVEKLSARLKEQRNPIAEMHIRAQILLDKRLFYAAFRETQRILDLVEDSPTAIAIQQAAVRGMDLQKTRLGEEVNRRAAEVKRRGSHARPPVR